MKTIIYNSVAIIALIIGITAYAIAQNSNNYTKYEFYNRLQSEVQRKFPSWEVSTRGEHIVVMQKIRTTYADNQPLKNEEELKKSYQAAYEKGQLLPLEILISPTSERSVSTSPAVAVQKIAPIYSNKPNAILERNENEQLKRKYAVEGLAENTNSGLYYAIDKEEKNRLVKYMFAKRALLVSTGRLNNDDWGVSLSASEVTPKPKPEPVSAPAPVINSEGGYLLLDCDPQKGLDCYVKITTPTYNNIYPIKNQQDINELRGLVEQLLIEGKIAR